MSLLILLSLAIGATAGVQLIKLGLGGWIMFALFAGLTVLGFYLLSAAYDPQQLDDLGNPVLGGQGWAGLCTVLFTLAMGIGALIASTVAQWPQHRMKGRRR